MMPWMKKRQIKGAQAAYWLTISELRFPIKTQKPLEESGGFGIF
jgi:hypothetical protein